MMNPEPAHGVQWPKALVCAEVGGSPKVYLIEVGQTNRPPQREGDCRQLTGPRGASAEETGG